MCLYDSEAAAINLVNHWAESRVRDAIGITVLGLQLSGCAAFIETEGGGNGPGWGRGGDGEGGAGGPGGPPDPPPGSTEINFCGLCFAAGTPVHTQRGNVPVEAIHVGDQVYALNAETGKTELRPVTALIPKHIGRLVELRIAGESDPLRASVAHPFWVKRSADERPHWINAANLRPGELAETIDGKWAEIQSVTPQKNEEIVYNFTVDKDHDYFVGQTGFLVHNDGPCPCGYRKTFFDANPGVDPDSTIVHHAIEQQTLENYPNLFSEAEIDGLGNLRGIPAGINGPVHLGFIRELWNGFYNLNPCGNATREDFFRQRDLIDEILGSWFTPPI